MVDRIITAYRAQIYDWSFADLLQIFNSNRALWFAIIGGMLVIAALLTIGLVFGQYYLAIIAFLLEAVAMICADRYAVKQYRKALDARKEHLKTVAEFLKTVVSEVDLYNSEQIGELANRLSRQIEEKRPFNRVGGRLKKFASAVIIPVVSYIAGAFSSYLQQVDFPTVVLYGVGVIITIATVWFTGSMLYDFIRPVLCRDFDAAVSLREDLLDLQLLFFPEKSK